MPTHKCSSDSAREEWRAIPSTGGAYEASSLGHIRSTDRYVGHRWGGRALKKGKVIAQVADRDGYLQVSVLKGGRRATRKAHQLVAEAFHGPSSGKQDVHHIDFDRANNAPSNLEWCSHQVNQRATAAAGRMGATSNPRRRKALAPADVQRIRERVSDGPRGTSRALAREYGVSPSTISHVVNRKSWSDGADHERDINAARNIVALGLQGLEEGAYE